MKPVNLNTAPCAPISSNCVIWQGPNIPCINLCNGDTVSDVVFALATELCGILETLNVANYDLTCFGITACGPNDFQALIQFLISQICELQGITPSTTKESTGCPDCLVTVAPCFVTNGQTTMNLTDYVNMIAQKICNIVDELALINAALTSLDIRVTILENAPLPTFSLPDIATSCQIGSLAAGSYQMDVLLNEFFPNVWCPLSDALGTSTAILAAVSNECIFGTDISLSTGAQMQIAFPQWNDIAFTPGTLASTINHLWISMCDMYSYLIANPITTTVVAAGTNVTVTSATVGTTTTYTVNSIASYDSGWKYVPGYNPALGYGVANLTNAPDIKVKIRITNRTVTINGLFPIPLATATGGAILVPDVGSWSSIASPYIFQGVAGGFAKHASGRMDSISPILPVALRPDVTQYINPAGHLIYRGYQIGSKRIALQSMCPYLYMYSTGQIGFGTIEEREGFGDYTLGFNGQLAELASIYKKLPDPPNPDILDTLPDYTNYESGYSLGVDQRLSPDNAAYPVPFDIDTRDGYQLGGFYMYMNNMYHLNINTPMQDIIDAFDNLP